MLRQTLTLIVHGHIRTQKHAHTHTLACLSRLRRSASAHGIKVRHSCDPENTISSHSSSPSPLFLSNPHTIIFHPSLLSLSLSLSHTRTHSHTHSHTHTHTHTPRPFFPHI